MALRILNPQPMLIAPDDRIIRDANAIFLIPNVNEKTTAETRFRFWHLWEEEVTIIENVVTQELQDVTTMEEQMVDQVVDVTDEEGNVTQEIIQVPTQVEVVTQQLVDVITPTPVVTKVPKEDFKYEFVFNVPFSMSQENPVVTFHLTCMERVKEIFPELELEIADL